jgi:CRP-like cAMP-binding protein
MTPGATGHRREATGFMREITPSLDQITRGLDASALSNWGQAANIGPVHGYPPGIELFKQGEPPRDVYLIEEGMVKLTYANENASYVMIGLRSSGWMLGTASVILDRQYVFSATTLTYSHLRHLTAESFLHLLNTDSKFAKYIHHAQSQEVHDLVKQMVGLGSLSARVKLERMLRELASALAPKENEKRVRLKLPLKHRHLAELVGVTPEHLSRVLKEMQNEGLILRERGWIHIVDVSLLQQSKEHRGLL